MTSRIAIAMERYGPPEVLRAVERPLGPPPPGEVTVRAVVSGVNRADLFIRSGEWPIAGPFPYVPGLEVAGTVESVGQGVAGFAPGDPVITMMQRLGGIHGERAGGYQSHVTVSADVLARLPAGFDPKDAGILGVPAVTAFLALKTLDVRTGHRVLVTAGSSAVGSMVLQMLRAREAFAIATTTRPAKSEHLRACGASELLDTSSPGWEKGLAPVDRVFDLVGQATFASCVGALKPGGRLVFVGGTSGGDLTFPGWALMRPVTLTGYSSETLDRAELERAVDAIHALSVAGALACHAVREVPLREAARAHEELASGRFAGRIVLCP